MSELVAIRMTIDRIKRAHHCIKMDAKMGADGRVKFSPKAWQKLKKHAGRKFDISADGDSILLKLLPKDKPRKKKAT